jgi:gas vesicle protein
MFGRKSTLPGFLITFGAGFITGAALALLYAPMPGKKMQKKVVDMTDKVIDKVDDLQESVRRFATA